MTGFSSRRLRAADVEEDMRAQTRCHCTRCRSCRLSLALMVDEFSAQKGKVLMIKHRQHRDCGCMALLSRRAALGIGLAAAAALPARAIDSGYEAMLVKCIDPRFTTNTWAYMSTRGWQNLYGQFNIAGGPIGLVAPSFASWHKTYWDNLEISYGLARSEAGRGDHPPRLRRCGGGLWRPHQDRCRFRDCEASRGPPCAFRGRSSRLYWIDAMAGQFTTVSRARANGAGCAKRSALLVRSIEL
jgi:hypothetical protein